MKRKARLSSERIAKGGYRMLKKPKLKKFLTIFPISETTWGLRGGSDELWRLKLRDEQATHALALLGYLNGQYLVDEIINEMATKSVEADEVFLLLQRMEDASLIEEADSFGLSEKEEKDFHSQITFFSRYTSEGGAKYQARIRASRVGIIGEGNLGKSLRRQLAEAGFGEIVLLSPDPAPIRENLNGHGSSSADKWQTLRVLQLDRDSVWIEKDESLPSLLFVAQEAEDPQLLEAVDRFSKLKKVPWLLVRALESHVGWVGPLFIPDETACYQSLEARLRSNLEYFPEHQIFTNYLREKRGPSVDCGGLHAFFELLSAIAVVEAIKFLANVTVPSLASRFLTINLSNWDVETHEVLRVPPLGLGVTEPRLFAWKEMPHIESHEEGSIYSRRS